MSFDNEGRYAVRETFDETDDPASVALPRYAERHQIAVQGADAVTGTLALFAVPFGKSEMEEVLSEDDGNQVVIDLAAEGVVVVDGVYTHFVFEPTSVTGAYTVSICGLK